MVRVHMCPGMYMEVKTQFIAVGSLFLACAALTLSLCHQAWQEDALSIELSVPPLFSCDNLCATISPHGTQRVHETKIEMQGFRCCADQSSSWQILPEVDTTVEDRIHLVSPTPHIVPLVRHHIIPEGVVYTDYNEKRGSGAVQWHSLGVLPCVRHLSPVC